MVVTFCGHSEIRQHEKVKNWLYSVIKSLIQQGLQPFTWAAMGLLIVWQLRFWES